MKIVPNLEYIAVDFVKHRMAKKVSKKNYIVFKSMGKKERFFCTINIVFESSFFNRHMYNNMKSSGK